MATAKKLPSGNYRCQVWDNRLQKRVSFTRSTKKAAELAALEYLASIENIENGIMTFRQAAEIYIDKRRATLSPTTIHLYEGYVKNRTQRFNDLLISKISTQLVQDWVNELTVSRTPKTVHNLYGFFTAVMNYHDININLRKIQLPKKTRHFKRLPTADIVLDTFKGTDIELPVLLAVWCGMRRSEILGIYKSDIDGDILTINRVLVTVGGKPTLKKRAKTYDSNRQIRLPKPILQLIHATNTAPNEPIIQISGKVLYDHFIKAMKQEGYSISFHDLRHINASVMAALGIPDLYAMQRGGWSNTSTLRTVYQQTFDNERVQIDKKIDNYFDNLYENNCTRNCTHEIKKAR